MPVADRRYSWPPRRAAAFALIAAQLVAAPAVAAPGACTWQAAWSSSQLSPAADAQLEPGALRDATLRQIVRPSLAAQRVRVRFSNAFGRAPLTIDAATVALAAVPWGGALRPATLRPLRFAGQPAVTVPAGAEWVSDAVELPLRAFDDLAVSLHLPAEPDGQTAHPGSRATSYLTRGDRTGATELPGARAVDRWYLLAGVEVERCAAPGGVVAFGDSITDGYGVKPNSYTRWTDVLARRLGGRVAVLNAGIGGNRVLLDGLGPSALARLDRDVFGQAGVRHLILFEGVNDIGVLTRDAPASPEQHRALVEGVTGAFAQIVARAHAHGIRVHAATILPFAGSAYYHPGAESEADRQAINAWLRVPGHVDSVIDLDQLLRDPARPTYLATRYDSGDGLHPNAAGYRLIGESIPLGPLRR
ncbi:SGNH/GDSL hydrolase family protein [Sphingomonas sp. BK580]|uniref:SGNH/GDSL hydrolase family protein n=1 Tax=Sphingomonas sp. BK580 TaxID=2586972 RepID=UPI00182163FE|nr:SGNH/GDSL hydrolase family protein [Sphingomonas sp. BK580]MBB3695869.1 lysophospholipase L1-like esterase [Sphingomonas sp. BK580]